MRVKSKVVLCLNKLELRHGYHNREYHCMNFHRLKYLMQINKQLKSYRTFKGFVRFSSSASCHICPYSHIINVRVYDSTNRQ
jgi:hypothetical protein